MNCSLMGQIESAKVSRKELKPLPVYLDHDIHTDMKALAEKHGVSLRALTTIAIKRGLAAIRQAERQVAKSKTESSASQDYIQNERGF